MHQYSRLNGVVPPGKVTAAESIQLLVRTPTGDGREMLVYRTIRRPGTRAPIHFHDQGGVTCLLEGESTLRIEGHAPKRYRAGDCFAMPPGVAMANFNSGKARFVTLDVFEVPSGAPVWRVAEPGQEAVQSQFKAKS